MSATGSGQNLGFEEQAIPASYVVYKKGGLFIAKGMGEKADDDFLGKDAAAVTRSVVGTVGSLKIQLKDGIFDLTSVVNTNIIINLGDQARTIVIQGMGIDNTVLKLGVLPAARYLFSRTPATLQTRLILRDLTLDWNASAQDYTGISNEQTAGVYLTKQDYSILERVKFANFFMPNGGVNTFGIGFNNFSSIHPRLVDCVFDTCDRGMWATNSPVDNGLIGFKAIRPISINTRISLIKAEAGSDIDIIDPYVESGTPAAEYLIDFEPTAINCRNYRVTRPHLRDPGNKADYGIFINGNILNAEIVSPEIDTIGGAVGVGIQANGGLVKIRGGKIFSRSTAIASSASTLLVLDGPEVKSTAESGIQSLGKAIGNGVIAHDCQKDGWDIRASGVSILGGKFYDNGQGLVANSRFGIGFHFTGDTKALISGVETYNVGAGTSQAVGIGDDSGFTPTNALIIGCSSHDNSSNQYGFVSSTARIVECPGFNPQATDTVTAGASAWTYTNTRNFHETLVLTTAGGVSAITYRGTAGYPITTFAFPFDLAPGETIVVTWATTAPVFTRYPR